MTVSRLLGALSLTAKDFGCFANVNVLESAQAAASRAELWDGGRMVERIEHKKSGFLAGLEPALRAGPLARCCAEAPPFRIQASRFHKRVPTNSHSSKNLLSVGSAFGRRFRPGPTRSIMTIFAVNLAERHPRRVLHFLHGAKVGRRSCRRVNGLFFVRHRPSFLPDLFRATIGPPRRLRPSEMTDAPMRHQRGGLDLSRRGYQSQ
jgi:hypothetical protein